MKVLKNKIIYTGNGKIDNGYVRFNQRISEVDEMRNFVPQEDDEIIETDATYVIPGFVDVHSHGGYGKDSMDASADEIDWMVRQMAAKEGITTYFCTTMTQTYDNIEKAMVQIKEAAEKNPIIQGIHLEGPFISVNYKGAQDASYIKKPDEKALAHWNELSGNRIRVVTYAPEEATEEFENWCLSNRIVPSAGHSDATYDQLVASRACHVTHLYNAMNPMGHREPGVIGAAADNQDCMVEMIGDGIHIHPVTVRNTFRLFGDSRVVLISDSMMATGMENGLYELGGQEVTMKDRKATLADGTIAGSATCLFDCMKCVISMGVPEREAILAATANPARSIGIYNEVGSLTPGKRADIVLTDEELNIVKVL